VPSFGASCIEKENILVSANKSYYADIAGDGPPVRYPNRKDPKYGTKPENVGAST
jgi:hypothetical protein